MSLLSLASRLPSWLRQAWRRLTGMDAAAWRAIDNQARAEIDAAAEAHLPTEPAQSKPRAGGGANDK